jgi:MFS family permease
MHRKHNDPIIDDKIQKSLNYSILDGSFFFVMMGFAEQYFQAFALFLKATVLQAGIVYSVPMFLGSILQLFSQKLLRLIKSRKMLILYVSLVRTLLFIPLIFVFFMGEIRVWILLLLISIYYSMNFLGMPAWTSWMGDLVNPDKRGAYFSKRNKIGNLVSMLSVVAGGLILRYFENTNTYVGFIIIFSVGFIASLLSVIFVTLKYESDYIEHQDSKFSLWNFTKKMPSTNYGRFVIYNFFLHFSVFLAAPYFTPYMLNVVNMNYLQFMISISIVTLFKFISMPIWGYFGDKYGNRKILILSGLIITILPLFWILANGKIWMIYLAESFAGVAWGGFDISNLNFIYDTTSNEKRVTCTSYLTFYRGLGIFTGGLIGGIMIKYVSFLGSEFFAIFLISTFLRFVTTVPIMKQLKEVRLVDQISYHDMVFQMVSAMPRGIQERIVNFRKRKKV